MSKSILKALIMCLFVMNVFACTPINDAAEQSNMVSFGIILSSETEKFDNLEGYKYFYLQNSVASTSSQTDLFEYAFTNKITVFENSENTSPHSEQNEYLLVIGDSNIESDFVNVSEYQKLLDAVLLTDTYDKKTNLIVMVGSKLCLKDHVTQHKLLKNALKNQLNKQSKSTNIPFKLNSAVCPHALESTNFFIPLLTDFYTLEENIYENGKNLRRDKPSLFEFVKSLEQHKSVITIEEEPQLNITNLESSRLLKGFKKDYIAVNLESFCAQNSRNRENEAKIERNRQRLQQFAIFQMTYSRLGIIFDLSNASETCLQETSEWLNSFLRSIQELQKNLNRMGLLAQDIRVDIYDFDQHSNQFAYMLKGDGNQRAFINFNFSFDVQKMLLPLGFMNSSKIDLWQSDASKVVTFVTNGNIATRPLSASVVMMN